MVCSETYYRRVMGEERTGTGLGVRWDGNLIYQHFYDAGAVNRKYIPVLLGGDQPAHIPAPAKGVTFYRPDSESGYEDLYGRLTDQPRARKPVLGKLRRLPSRDRRWSERPVESDRSSERPEARDRRSEAPAGVEGLPGSSIRRSSRLNETVVLAPKAAQRGTGPNHAVAGAEVRTARRPGSFERGTHAHLGLTAAVGLGGLLIVAAVTFAITSMSPVDERIAQTAVEAPGGRSVDITVWQGRLGEVYDVYKNGKFVGATTRYVLVSKTKSDQITCEKGGKTFIPISRGDDNGEYYCEKWW